MKRSLVREKDGIPEFKCLTPGLCLEFARYGVLSILLHLVSSSEFLCCQRGEQRTGAEGKAAGSPTPHPVFPAKCFGSGLFSSQGSLSHTAQMWLWSSSNWYHFFFGLINISTAAAARVNLPELFRMWLTLVFPLPIISAAVFSLKLPLPGFA